MLGIVKNKYIKNLCVTPRLLCATLRHLVACYAEKHREDAELRGAKGCSEPAAPDGYLTGDEFERRCIANISKFYHDVNNNFRK